MNSFKNFSASNAYDLLGIPRGSSEKTIKQAYRRLALLYHPDKAGHAATAKFQELDAAYRALLNRKRECKDEPPDHPSDDDTSHGSKKPQPQFRKPAWCTGSEFPRVHWLLQDYLATQKRDRSRAASFWVLLKEGEVERLLKEMISLYHKRLSGSESELYSKIGHVLKALRMLKIATAPSMDKASRLSTRLSLQTMLSITNIRAFLNSGDELQIGNHFGVAPEAAPADLLWKLGQTQPGASSQAGGTWRPAPEPQRQSGTFKPFAESSSNTFTSSKFTEGFQWGYGSQQK
ncbi:hypothetical protein OHC33_000773 [Knufia fluminis]|uniref:J domain-containing protein n=1 Tax=Knufia fluminis TaxID=191047 RepID=A0AAN8F016_9EURO|nr:hypothetical protein OHC33_000773 [Knufia fluminis]